MLSGSWVVECNLLYPLKSSSGKWKVFLSLIVFSSTENVNSSTGLFGGQCICLYLIYCARQKEANNETGSAFSHYNAGYHQGLVPMVAVLALWSWSWIVAEPLCPRCTQPLRCWLWDHDQGLCTPFNRPFLPVVFQSWKTEIRSNSMARSTSRQFSWLLLNQKPS